MQIFQPVMEVLRINAEPILDLAKDFKNSDVHFIWKQSETIFQEFCSKFFKKFKAKDNSKKYRAEDLI